VIAGDVTGFARILLASPAVNQSRWTDQNLVMLADRAAKAVVTELLFPESRITTTLAIATTQQLFQLPESLRIYRVYVNGTIAVEVPGNLATLEGRQVGIYDQSGSGTPVTGMDAPPGTAGQGVPEWTVVTPTTFPYLIDFGTPAPYSQPAFINSQLRYYRRGGAIGFVPALTGPVTIDVDGVFTPATLSSVASPLQVPENFMDVLAWKVVSYAKFADDTDRSSDQRNYATGMYEQELGRQRTWVRQYSLQEGSQIFAKSYRGLFRIGGNRAGGVDC
jgi:hypothetical protein